jgi:hypothetical protein
MPTRLRPGFRGSLLMGQAQGVACHRHPLREDSLILHGRPAHRSCYRLAYELTGPRITFGHPRPSFTSPRAACRYAGSAGEHILHRALNRIERVLNNRADESG